MITSRMTDVGSQTTNTLDDQLNGHEPLTGLGGLAIPQKRIRAWLQHFHIIKRPHQQVSSLGTGTEGQQRTVFHRMVHIDESMEALAVWSWS